MTVGIDAICHYIPELFLPIKDLAVKRGIEPDKLEKGLGLIKMSINDVNEDTATLAANALLKLFTTFGIDPKEVDRIYLGTESALDASKPTAIYASQMVEEKLAKQHGERCFAHVDITDITFACVGAIDAFQNCLDYIKANPERKAIVIAADFAKYTLNSTGEYTQGSGAVAMLLAANPRLMSFDGVFGVATQSVFDFFKPKRKIMISSALQKELNTCTIELDLVLDEPIFDGQYSNDCYKKRIREAYFGLKKKLDKSKEPLYKEWEQLIFHLPYAFQGKRMFMDLFAIEQVEWAKSVLGETAFDEEELSNHQLKEIGKTEDYQAFVSDKITNGQLASSQVGNLYTASIFFSLLSSLSVLAEKNEQFDGKKIGFLSYGSGSKSKVFEGTLVQNWKKQIEPIDLFESLKNRTPITFEEYESLHKKELKNPLGKQKGKFVLASTESEVQERVGARYYTFLD